MCCDYYRLNLVLVILLRQLSLFFGLPLLLIAFGFPIVYSGHIYFYCSTLISKYKKVGLSQEM